MRTLTPQDSDYLSCAVEESLLKAADAIAVALEIERGGGETSASKLLLERGWIDSQQHRILSQRLSHCGNQQHRQPGGTSASAKSGRDAAGTVQLLPDSVRGSEANVSASGTADSESSTDNGVSAEASRSPQPPTSPIQNDPTAGLRASSSSADRKSAGHVAGRVAESERYEWQEQFAQGGLGAIWRARDKQLDRSIALKELLPQALQSPGMQQRFVNEAQITGQLDHPGIVPIYDLGFHDDGRPYYAMKLLEGGTLAEAIRQLHEQSHHSDRFVLKQRELLAHFVSICRAVAFAHEKKVIHRDLKPENVLLGKFGEAIVLDWGLAKRVSERKETVNIQSGSGTHHPESPNPHSGTSSLPRSASLSLPNSATRFGTILGTPAYMSPEQASGETSLDLRTDIYSLGVILYEILVGHVPFSGNDTREVIRNVRGGEFQPPRELNREVSAGLNSICLHAMQRKPQDRFRTAMQMADEVARWLGGECPTCHQESPIHQFLRWSRKHRRLVVSTISVVALTAVVAIGASFAINVARLEEADARRQAQAAWLAESKAKNQAQLAKDLAMDRLKDARQSADHWLIELSGDLEYYPGLAPTRHRLLKTAEEQYRRHIDRAIDELALPGEAALAHLRLGDVVRLLGDPLTAQSHYITAEQQFAKLHSEDPDQSQWILQLANSRIGKLLSGEFSPTELAELQKRLDDDAARLREKLEGDPLQHELRGALARIHLARAQNYRRSKDLPAAAQRCRLAVEQLSRLVVLQDSLRNRERLVAALLEWGDVDFTSGNSSAAINHWLRALRESEMVRSAQPNRPDLIEREAILLTKLGNAYQQEGDSAQSQELYERSITNYGHVVQLLYETPFCSENLAIAEFNLALVLKSQGSHGQALERLENAAEEFAQVIHLQGQTEERLVSFARCHQELGDMYAMTDEDSMAHGAYSKALTVWEHLGGVVEESTEIQHNVAYCRNRIDAMANSDAAR